VTGVQTCALPISIGASALLARNLFIYGFGGVVLPFIGIKIIDLIITAIGIV